MITSLIKCVPYFEIEQWNNQTSVELYHSLIIRRYPYTPTSTYLSQGPQYCRTFYGIQPFFHIGGLNKPSKYFTLDHE